MPCSARVSTRMENPRSCRASGRSRCARPPRCRSPTGCPGHWGRPPGSCRGLCARWSDRVDRREVQHVEAHGRHGRHPLRVPARPPCERGTARTRRHQGPLAVHPQRRRRARVTSGAPSGPESRSPRAGATAGRATGRCPSGRTGRSQPIGQPTARPTARPTGRRRPGRRGAAPPRRSPDRRPGGGQLGPDPLRPRGMAIGPRLDHQAVRPGVSARGGPPQVVASATWARCGRAGVARRYRWTWAASTSWPSLKTTASPDQLTHRRLGGY